MRWMWCGRRITAADYDADRGYDPVSGHTSTICHPLTTKGRPRSALGGDTVGRLN